MLAVSRFFHMITSPGVDFADPVVNGNASYMAAVYTGDVCQKLFALQCMKPEFTWTEKILAGLKMYLEWMQSKLRKLICVNPGDVASTNHSTVIDQMIKNLAGGVMSKCKMAKKARHHGRRAVDAERLDKFPSIPVMKVAVGKAMASLRRIVAEHEGSAGMTVAARCTANA